jgi:hypothetical protein
MKVIATTHQQLYLVEKIQQLEEADYCRTPTKHRINVIEGSANDSLPKNGNIKQAVQRKSWRNNKDRKVEPSYASDGRKALRHILNEHIELPHHHQQRQQKKVRPRRTSLPGEIFSCRLCTIEAWHYEGPV